jgi:hypothetical protein
MAAHVHVTEPAGLVEMRERSFQQLTASAGNYLTSHGQR